MTIVNSNLEEEFVEKLKTIKEGSEILRVITLVEKYGMDDPEAIIMKEDGHDIIPIQENQWMINYQIMDKKYSLFVKKENAIYSFYKLEIQN